MYIVNRRLSAGEIITKEIYQEIIYQDMTRRNKKLADYVKINKNDAGIDVWFYNEEDKPFAIGEKMNEINEEAYMNGYNWDAFFNYYLTKNAPDILEGMDSDPEAGSYAAHFERTEENEEKAERFVEIIVSLIENEEELYRIVREEGGEIEWD